MALTMTFFDSSPTILNWLSFIKYVEASLLLVLTVTTQHPPSLLTDSIFPFFTVTLIFNTDSCSASVICRTFSTQQKYKYNYLVFHVCHLIFMNECVRIYRALFYTQNKEVATIFSIFILY